MFGLGMPELAVVFVLVILLFGPSRVPQMGKALGDSIREFRKAGEELVKKDEDEK